MRHETESHSVDIYVDDNSAVRLFDQSALTWKYFASGREFLRNKGPDIEAGAIEFLEKPIHEQDLLDAVQLALQQDRSRREAENSQAELRTRYEVLTPREQ